MDSSAERIAASHEDAGVQVEDAEVEFRRRLAAKLGARGYAGQRLNDKIDELLRKGVRLRLDIPAILGQR